MAIEFLTTAHDVALVDSTSKRGWKLEIAYSVIYEEGVFYCECPDFKRRLRRARIQPLVDTECKHIRGVIDTLTQIVSGKICSECHIIVDILNLETCNACINRASLAAALEHCECGMLLFSDSPGLCDDCTEKAMNALLTSNSQPAQASSGLALLEAI